MLNVLSVLLDGGDRQGLQRAAHSLERQGFARGTGFDWVGGALRAWTHPAQSAVKNCDVRTPSGDACCIGPIWYRGRFGSAALGLLIDDASATGRVDEMALRGNFALFLRTQQQCLLMNDALGFVHLYASADGYFYSTSWLATCAYAGRVAVDEAAAAEYVLLGASHSDRTVAQGITRLPLAHAFDLTHKCARARLPADTWDAAWVPTTLDAAVDGICAHLQTVCGEVVTAFSGRTRTALSGGFDSRLILAGLLACGDRPGLFVYGARHSDDVQVARTVAGDVGLPVEVVDKRALDRGRPRPDLERLVENALFFDGLPSDGIYDSGSDRESRLAQTAGGYIALNGGGGEIFRNYFHLPDRALRALDVVRSFYRGFDRGVFRRHGGLASFESRLAASIARQVGKHEPAPRSLLARDEVELVYPLFRCHYWMGVNNSIATRHGYFATPLVDPTLVRLARRLPLAWKNAGRLESRLIACLHPQVASAKSSYGFRFSDGPDYRMRIAEWATRIRPISTRPFIGAVRRRVNKSGVAPDMIAHCRALLPGEWRLDPLLDLERLPDAAAFARALAVEVVWRELL